tara:strand:+ start:175 stop:408 length:234 start_codon:yes stop_codon:yes gene_type:complete
MDSQLKIDRGYIEEEIQRQYDYDKKELDKYMKLLEKTSDDELSLKMWRVDQSFMDTLSELGSDMVSELLDKLGEKDE